MSKFGWCLDGLHVNSGREPECKGSIKVDKVEYKRKKKIVTEGDVIICDCQCHQEG